MAGFKTVTPPDHYPVDVRDVKNFLRLDEDEDELYVRSLIGAATEYVEQYTGRALINRTVLMAVDGVAELDVPLMEGLTDGPDLPLRKRHMNLPFGNVSSITHVKYYSDDDTEYTMDGDTYYLDSISVPAKIVLRSGSNWPTSLRVANGIQITYVAGYGSNPKQVPEQIRLAIMQYVAFMYEHRGETEGNVMPQMPNSIPVLLQPYKIYSFAGKELN